LIYSEALVILSPLTKSDWRIAAIAEAHFNQFLVDLESFRTSNTRQTWNAKLASSSNLKLTSYGFVAREADGDEGEEATAAKAAAAAAAAAAEAVVVAAAARSNRPNYSLD
jgi:hypothetical protein